MHGAREKGHCHNCHAWRDIDGTSKEPHIRTAHMIWPRLGFGGALVKSQICGLGETVGSTLGSDSCEKSKSTP
jgi:hypothetical protein